MRRLLGLGAAVVLAAAGIGRAQIVYLPLQYQFQGPQVFYYGGSNPDVFRYATWPGTTKQGMVFSDRVSGLQDARYFGYGPDDAANEAYQSVPRYFNKRDILRQAVPQPDGVWAVPAQAGELPKYVATTAGKLQEASANKKPGVIIIIPKKKAAGPVKAAMFVSARD
jgi:hypothetical protein